jgi:hypothetical protein
MIAISLISFVIPMAIGVFVKHKKPELADRIQSLVSRFTFLNYSHFALEKKSNKKQLFKGIKNDHFYLNNLHNKNNLQYFE